MPNSLSCCPTWSLNRLLVLLLLGGYVTLLVDIRFEHVDVVQEHWTGWIPLVYCALMIILTAATLAAWNAVTRLILFCSFALGLVVSGWGLWIHNHIDRDNFGTTLRDLTQAWYVKDAHHPPGIPPHLAPIAFAGLALIGMLCTAKALQPNEK